MSDTPLELLDTAHVVDEVVRGQEHVVDVVRAARAQIISAVDTVTAAQLRGGRIIFAGAGTSGRLGLLEAVEVPATFGIAPDRVVALIAGASPEEPAGRDDAEDDDALGRADVDTLGLGPDDVLVAIAASGATPYTLAAADAARQAGAAVVAVTNVRGSALAAAATQAIEVPTGPEVVFGSTRLAAGAAQKLVLNTLTTAAMVRAGRVHGRFMVDVVPANAKLRTRAIGVITAVCGVPDEVALDALKKCENDVRAAIVHLICRVSPEEAAQRAAAHRTVREAINASRRSSLS